MARPLSEEKRTQLILAAIDCIDEHGLSASTAMIAKTAGVSAGSLFTYFQNKDELINTVYLHIKAQIADVVMADFPKHAPFAKQLEHWWHHYVNWGVANPKHRQVSKQIALSVHLTAQIREQVYDIYQEMRHIFQQEIDGNRFYAPLDFSVLMMEHMAEATILHIIAQPSQADEYLQTGLDMVKRAIVR